MFDKQPDSKYQNSHQSKVENWTKTIFFFAENYFVLNFKPNRITKFLFYKCYLFVISARTREFRTMWEEFLSRSIDNICRSVEQMISKRENSEPFVPSIAWNCDLDWDFLEHCKPWYNIYY